MPQDSMTPEHARLDEDRLRAANWKRWGPYLAERQWATVREDYSADGDCWNYFPHDHARSRAYRWGEDGLLGWSDRQCRLCFAVALWNGRDPILKERLFGLTSGEGNHGEDVKECYYYLDSTPTHSYAKALYKYPQAAFPYEQLVRENARRGRDEPEFELEDTGVFDASRYFDVVTEYAKAAPDDLLIRVTIHNRGPDAAPLHVLPTLWFRNVWSSGCTHEGCGVRHRLRRESDTRARASHDALGEFFFDAVTDPALRAWLFTENDTNVERLFGAANPSPYVKDAFDRYVVRGEHAAVNPKQVGSKCAPYYAFDAVPAGESVEIRLRLRPEAAATTPAIGDDFDAVFAARLAEANTFYDVVLDDLTPSPRSPTAGRGGEADNAPVAVARQAYAGLLWSKQFYHYSVDDWLDGDPGEPRPPDARHRPGGRNVDWRHLFNRDVLLVPDKWEYPWYAAWDLAFHCVAVARVDPELAKEQLVLLCREWYMHPSGQFPAYEFAFDDVNPPVQAWAAFRTYKIAAPKGRRDRVFLARVFQKYLINFTWWVNRKDVAGRHVFAGGFLGLDNVGVFDRSRPLPGGAQLAQADGTAWMAFYCVQMLAMALELAAGDGSNPGDPAYEDVASKFFEHFVAIVDAMNSLGGHGLWDDEDGFYHDQLRLGGQDGCEGAVVPVRLRSMVGLIPLLACLVIDREVIDRLPAFARRMDWFMRNRPDLARSVTLMAGRDGGPRYLLAVPTRERLERVLACALAEEEFLSPHGLRSLSKAHAGRPFSIELDGATYSAGYEPGESQTSLFGGNSNWRGPVWMPVNALIVEALERYHYYYGDDLRVELPTGSGRRANLKDAAAELSARLCRLFLPDPETGRRPCCGDDPRYATDPHWRDHVPFHEYFHGDTGAGLGASHQTGWTALVASLLSRSTPPPPPPPPGGR